MFSFQPFFVFPWWKLFIWYILLIPRTFPYSNLFLRNDVWWNCYLVGIFITIPNTLSCNFIMLAHWNNSLWVDMSLHSDTLSFLIVFGLSHTRQTEDYKIGICCFSTKNTALRRKSKDWLAYDKDNVSEWSDMSIRVQLFQWASTIKIHLSMLVLYKADLNSIMSLKIIAIIMEISSAMKITLRFKNPFIICLLIAAYWICQLLLFLLEKQSWYMLFFINGIYM
jgi:hypothetical protein